MGTPFIFREPLGQVREVKVALSGFFGRFVACAYLERYFNLSIFAHLGGRTIDLDRRRRVKIKRLSRGDLPDWIACASDLSSLTVAEAKSCHDPGGPAKAPIHSPQDRGRERRLEGAAHDEALIGAPAEHRARGDILCEESNEAASHGFVARHRIIILCVSPGGAKGAYNAEERGASSDQHPAIAAGTCAGVKCIPAGQDQGSTGDDLGLDRDYHA